MQLLDAAVDDRAVPSQEPAWLVPRSAYLHVPFCRTKCLYCDFNTYAGKDRLIGEYVAALVAETTRRIDETGAQPLETIYFGGGTPSLLAPAQVGRLMAALRLNSGIAPAAEVSFEANPGTFGEHYLHALLDCGINRLSLGMQSLRDETLRKLARTHNAAQALGAVRIARAAGVPSVSLDLIYGLPWQTRDQWVDDLQRALETEPDHVSLYALMVEEGTPLSTLVARGSWPVADSDLSADMYEAALPILERAGFLHYEISNWARAGHESRHNLRYWRNEAYLGLGAGAHSYVGGRRFWNVRGIEDYIVRSGARRPLVDGDERLDAQSQIGETAMLALRLRRQGIEFERFRRRFGVDPLRRWEATIEELERHNLLQRTAERIILTDAALLVSNEIGSRFLA